MNNLELYNELKLSLPTSSAEERKVWASIIIEEEIEIKDLSNLLFCEKKIASRFSWLLSGIGALDSNKLLNELPFLYSISDQITNINFKHSFATYWSLCGVPSQNEAEAIDLLLGWIQSSKINVTTKSRSLFAFYNLTKKYPDLHNELKHCLEDQLDKNTTEFKKRALKILDKLDH